MSYVIYPSLDSNFKFEYEVVNGENIILWLSILIGTAKLHIHLKMYHCIVQTTERRVRNTTFRFNPSHPGLLKG